MTGWIRTFWAAVALALALGAASGASALDSKVVDAATGAAAPDASVVIAGREVRTDKAGGFHLDGAAGPVFARAPGYRAATLSLADLAKSGGAIRLTPFTPKALYLTVYGVGSKTLRGGAMALIHSGSANALVIDLKGDRGIVPYPSKVALTASPGARRVTTISDLPALVAQLHASGVYLIARIVVFKDEPLAAARPDLAVKRADGRLFRDREHLAWTDPFQPEVQAYNIDLAIEAAQAGFDEIQFDYLRFPDSSAKLRLAKPSNIKNRTAAIAGFLAAARQRLRPYNVYLGADIFGYVCWNQDDTGIGQRLEELMPNVDYLSPMLYPSGFRFGIPGVRNPVANSYTIVRDSLGQARMRLNVSPKRFRPWLQAFRDYAFDRRVFAAQEVADQIRAAADFGSDGWMLWNAGNTYSGLGLALAEPAGRGGVARRSSPASQACS
ncbi:MAG: putative glycoside hydrolase [Caulobacteraceae bacterium]|nr:putative glycoside hydrolase [Caulobacteraceae bacterium]